MPKAKPTKAIRIELSEDDNRNLERQTKELLQKMGVEDKDYIKSIQINVMVRQFIHGLLIEVKE